MKLTALSDKMCGAKNCPAVYVDEAGDFVVQGAELDAAGAEGFAGTGPGERAVRVPVGLLLEAVDRYRGLGRAER